MNSSLEFAQELICFNHEMNNYFNKKKDYYSFLVTEYASSSTWDFYLEYKELCYCIYRMSFEIEEFIKKYDLNDNSLDFFVASISDLIKEININLYLEYEVSFSISTKFEKIRFLLIDLLHNKNVQNFKSVDFDSL